MSKAILYFSIAALTALTQAVEQPKTPWDWLRLVSIVLTQGFVALKALESKPGTGSNPTVKTEIVNTPGNPVNINTQ